VVSSFSTSAGSRASTSTCSWRLRVDHDPPLRQGNRTLTCAQRFDFAGIALLSAGLFCLVWALIKGSSYGWASAATISFFVGSALALAFFVLCESKVPNHSCP